MGDGVFRTGWAVYREHRGEVLLPERVRLRLIVAGSAAAFAGALVTVTLVVWRWAPVPLALGVVGVLALAAAGGCLVVVFVRVAAPRGDWSFRPTGDWRRSERIRRQFAERPPEMAAADRDEVLLQSEQSRGPLIGTLSRTLALPAGWLLAWVGFLALGSTSDDVFLLWYVPLMAVLQSALPVAALSGLGRAELARRRAEALPPLPPPPPERPRGRGPTGTKLGLPD